MPTDTRWTGQAPKRLSAQVIEGFERRVAESAGIPIAKLPEIIALRAIARELIAHINAMEFEQNERMGIDETGSARHSNHAGLAGDSQRRKS